MDFFFFFFESYTQQTGVQLGPEGHGMETATWLTRTENHTELARTRGCGAGAGRHERLDARERGAQPQRVQSSGREVSVEVQRQKIRRERGRRRQPTAGRKTIGRKKEGKGEAPPANGREEDHTVRATGEAGERGGGGQNTHTHQCISAKGRESPQPAGRNQPNTHTQQQSAPEPGARRQDSGDQGGGGARPDRAGREAQGANPSQAQHPGRAPPSRGQRSAPQCLPSSPVEELGERR